MEPITLIICAAIVVATAFTKPNKPVDEIKEPVKEERTVASEKK